MTDKPAILGGKPVREKPLGKWPIIGLEEAEAVLRVLKRGKLFASMYEGYEVPAFEEEFAKAVNAEYAVAVSSGTAALDIVLKAIGIGLGDEVITTPYTFIATATSIVHNHAIPVFADIDPKTRNLDPEKVREKITDKTKAIIVVHLAGHPAEMDEFRKIAEEYDLYIIEDAAQAHLAEYKGRKVGTLGHAAIFSFQQSKNMTAGEGGIITTNDPYIAERCMSLREHGRRKDMPWYYHQELGWNYRMTELQAAILREQLKRLPKITEERRRNAEYLRKILEEFKEYLQPGYVAPYVKHAYHLFLVDYYPEKTGLSKEVFVKAVSAEGIPLTGGYMWPVYQNPVFRENIPRCPFKCPVIGRKIEYPNGLCPIAEEFCSKRGLWLPGHVLNVYREELDDIAYAINKVLKYSKEIATSVS